MDLISPDELESWIKREYLSLSGKTGFHFSKGSVKRGGVRSQRPFDLDRRF